MRRTVRVFSSTGPTQRLAEAIAPLPPSVRSCLADVAQRTDLPLVAGVWRDGSSGGCLVANVVTALDADDPSDGAATLDLRILELVPQMSSRDLNRLIVAWDEAADVSGADDDADLRTLLRDALTMAGVPLASATAPRPEPATDR